MPDIKRDLANYRLDTAKQNLKDAADLFKSGSYKSSANRSYYAVFHAMRSVLALDEFDSKKHSGVIGEFRKNYIKTEKFPIEYSDIVTKLFAVRTSSDYEDFFMISKSEAENKFLSAEAFVNGIEKYLTEL
jgi:uncharacterized protein (UPF0332 family)